MSEHECEYRIENIALQAEVNTLAKRISEIETELAKYKGPAKDSGNSSNPPSKDQNRNCYPEREKSGKKPGGQPGHVGHHHSFTQTPDNEVACEAPVECEHCHSRDLTLIEGGEKRQVVDIPEPRVEVTEYQQTQMHCNTCGKVSKSKFPKGVDSHVQIGERAQGLAVLLKTNHAVSDDRVVELFSDVFDLKVSKGWVENTLTKWAQRLLPIYTMLLLGIIASSVVGSDETGNHVNGKKVWTWVFQTVNLVYFKTVQSRGFKVIEETIGDVFDGTWVSDRLAAQLKLVADFNQWCLAHIIRDCRFLIQSENNVWAIQFKQVLTQAIDFRNEQGEQYDPELQMETIKVFEAQVNDCFGLDPPKSKKGQTLFTTLRFSQNRLLHFLYDPNVPPTNNDSERPLRQTKLLQKVFGGFRTLQGAQRYDIFLSIIQSAKRQGLNVLDVLTEKSQLAFPSLET